MRKVTARQRGEVHSGWSPALRVQYQPGFGRACMVALAASLHAVLGCADDEGAGRDFEARRDHALSVIQQTRTSAEENRSNSATNPLSIDRSQLLQEYESAERVLLRKSSFEANDPHLIRAVFTLKPKHIEIRWLSSGFTVSGIYLIDEQGHSAQVKDDRFSDALRDDYANTLMRVQAVKLLYDSEKGGASRGVPLPVVVVPDGFELQGAQVGLIDSERGQLPSERILGNPDWLTTQ